MAFLDCLQKDYTVFSVPLKTAAAQFCAAAVEA
jgi:hypothetical protein